MTLRSLRARLSLGAGLLLAAVLAISGPWSPTTRRRTRAKPRRPAATDRGALERDGRGSRGELPARDRPAAERGATRHGQLGAPFLADAVVLEAGRPALLKAFRASGCARSPRRGALPRAGDPARRYRPGRPGQARGRLLAGRRRAAPIGARQTADLARPRRPARLGLGVFLAAVRTLGPLRRLRLAAGRIAAEDDL